MANAKAYDSKNGKFKTPELKYSSSLNENPIGSFSFINPEMMNNNPTKILLTLTIYFIKF